MENTIIKSLNDSIQVKQEISNSPEVSKIAQISQDIITCLKDGNKVLFAGNGGSCSDAFHLAGEFISRFMFDRKPLPAIALGANNSILTAVGNDYSYNDVISREIEVLGKKGDVFIAITTSGNSRNILQAVGVAQTNGVKCVGLTGDTGGKLAQLCDCICAPSRVTARIQEAHITIGHIICEIVEKEMFK